MKLGLGLGISRYTQTGLRFLFANGELDAWYDPSDISTLWQDAARTTPVTEVGQSVLAIDDKSPAGRHLTVLTGTAGVYAVDADGNGYVDHSGGAGGLHATGYDLTQPASLFFAGVTNTVNSGHLITATSGSSIRTMRIQVSTLGARALSNQLRNATGNEIVTGSTASAKPDTPIVAMFGIEDGLAFAAMNDDNQEISQELANTGDTGMTGWRIGYGSCGIGPIGVKKFYGAIVFGAGTTALSRRNIRGYLTRKIGLHNALKQEFDVFIGMGQSNLLGSSGQADTFGSPQPSFGDAIEWLTSSAGGGSLIGLADPVRGSALGSERATDCSLWPSFATEYHNLTGRAPLIISGAFSGQGLTEGATPWNTDTLIDPLVDQYLAAKARIESKGGDIARVNVVWLGGEADALASVTKATFKTAFAELLARVRTKFSAPSASIFAISIDRTTNSAQDAAFSEIRDAISESATEVDGIHLAMAYQDYVTQGLLADAIHWNNVALNDAGNRAATSVASVLG